MAIVNNVSNDIKPSLPLTDKAKKYAKEAVSLIKMKKNNEAYALLIEQTRKGKKNDKIAIYYVINELFKKSDSKLALQALDAITLLDRQLTLPLLLKAKIYEENREGKNAVEVLTQMLALPALDYEFVEAARILSRFGSQSLALEASNKGYFEAGEKLSLATYPLRVASQNADWDAVDKITSKLEAAHNNDQTKLIGETPRTHLLWCADESINQKVIQNFATKVYTTQTPLSDAPKGDPAKRKIRIGYLSNDFRDHATSILAMGMMRHHNKSRFEIIYYDTSYDDGSALRRQIFSKANLVRSIAKVSDKVAADLIFKDGIDVLVDLNGLTEGTRLGIFSYRPAPVQISYLGFPGSAGNHSVDYIVADDYTIPEMSSQYYPEAIIRIPNTYQINDYVALYLPPKPPLKALGLPNEKVIIGMFNNVNKVGREVWDTWMRILKENSNTVLWMLDPGEVARTKLLADAKRYSLDQSRFFWAKKVNQEEHLARIQHCAIALDPWPYGGHTTTSDALFAGVPVIALEGTNFASRVSGGLLKSAGLESLIAKSKKDYVKLATDLISNNQVVAKLKKHLLNNKKSLPLFDSPSRTKHLEAAYIYAASIASKKMKPTSFTINQRINSKKGS